MLPKHNKVWTQRERPVFFGITSKITPEGKFTANVGTFLI